MSQTYWYAYDGEVSGPFFERRDEAAADCDDGERPRPVSGDVIDTDADSETTRGAKPLDDMSHDELKAEAERRGIAAETDLRSKASIREALREDA